MGRYIDEAIVTKRTFWRKHSQDLADLRRHYQWIMDVRNFVRVNIPKCEHIILGRASVLNTLCFGIQARDEDWLNKIASTDNGPWIVLGLIDDRIIPAISQMPDLFKKANHNPGNATGLSARPRVKVNIYGYCYPKLGGQTMMLRGKDIFKNVIFLANNDLVCYAVNLSSGQAARLPKQDWENIYYDMVAETKLIINYESDDYCVEFNCCNQVISKHELKRTSAIQLVDSFILDGVLLD